MKDKMKQYEKFIWQEIEEGNQSGELLSFHKEMVHCFQHERAIHLAITISAVSIVSLGADWWVMWPLYIATLIVAILAIAYVKYYYFLENHTQYLYKATAILSGFPEEIKSKDQKTKKNSKR